MIVSDLIGKPFKNGGRGPDDYDCWGLVCEVFRRAGIELPDYKISCFDSMRIFEAYQRDVTNWIQTTKPPVPALVVIKFNSQYINHVGVYLGKGQFIHAFRRAGVCIDSLNGINGQYWRKAVQGFYIPGW